MMNKREAAHKPCLLRSLFFMDEMFINTNVEPVWNSVGGWFNG
jgi:hypothetical protein